MKLPIFSKPNPTGFTMGIIHPEEDFLTSLHSPLPGVFGVDRRQRLVAALHISSVNADNGAWGGRKDRVSGLAEGRVGPVALLRNKRNNGRPWRWFLLRVRRPRPPVALLSNSRTTTAGDSYFRESRRWMDREVFELVGVGGGRFYYRLEPPSRAVSWFLQTPPPQFFTGGVR
jgi:hypothetical protein